MSMIEDIRRKFVPPSISETAFNCPHCGALARQDWRRIHAVSIKTAPTLVRSESLPDFSEIKDANQAKKLRAYAERLAKGRPFLDLQDNGSQFAFANVFASQCFNCNEPAIWIYDRLIWPRQNSAASPNPDLPDDVLQDYHEAAVVLEYSPRGAAALLRLALQKLCVHLGQKGENINLDIGALVKRGLDIRVQQALDVVRVVGNNAVHPGQIDLKDNRDTAEKLFGLINIIAEVMITQPREINRLYEGLPESARRAIERRDE